MAAARPYLLYGNGVAQSASVEALLRELGLPYALRTVDLSGRGEGWCELQRINPAGFVPALVLPDGTVMHETAAILLYLTDLRADAGLAPLPHAPLRAQFLSRFLYLNNDVASRSKTFFYPHRWSTCPADGDRIGEAAFEAVIESWKLVEEWLAQPGPFVLGERFSIADLVVANWAAYGLQRTGDIIERYPAVAGCCEAVRARAQSGPVFLALDEAVELWRSSG